MFGFSGEHLLVLLVILLIFGPKRLPDLGHSLGRTLKNFKDGMGGTTSSDATPSTPPAQISPQPVASKAAPSTAAPLEAENPAAEARETEKV